MLSKTHYPESLPPDQLDEYLEKGWFRMGQMIFTCHFLCLEGDLYSPVWVRLSLTNHTFSKRLRKKIRKVESQFLIEVKPFELNEEKEALYQLHKSRFSGFICETLAESLLEFSSENIYITYEVEVYDKDKLIAVSFFDLGCNSIASILGLFHPDYEKYSLGLYTMLAEVQYGQKLELEYYYPGYIIHKYPKFDYKLRLGKMDFFDFNNQNWFPIKDLDINKLPGVRLKKRLSIIQKKLTEAKIDSQLLLYPLYDKMSDADHQNSFMNSPMFIACKHNYLSERVMVIEYDLEQDIYRLSIYSRLDNMFFFFSFLMDDAHDLDNTYFDYLICDYVIVESELPEVIINALESESPEKVRQDNFLT